MSSLGGQGGIREANAISDWLWGDILERCQNKDDRSSLTKRVEVEIVFQHLIYYVSNYMAR